MRGLRPPKWFREEEAAKEQEAERHRQEEEQRRLSEAEAALTTSHRKLVEFQKNEVLAGRSDPDFEMPESTQKLRMSIDQGLEFVAKSGRAFVAETPEFFNSPRNIQTITSYLDAQGVRLPDVPALNLAFERCSCLGLLEERPESSTVLEPASPEPAPAEPVPESDDLVDGVDGFDIKTAEPRRYSQREVWQMDSTTFRKAFRAFGDNRPRFTRGYFQ